MSYINTGRQIIGILQQVAVYPNGDRVLTGVTKPNDIGDPDYLPPIDDADSHIACPVPTTTTTTSTSTTTSSTTTTTTLGPDAPDAMTLGAAYGMTIASVTGSSTGIPSDFATANLHPTNYMVRAISSPPGQTLTVVLTGTPVTSIQLDLVVNEVLIQSVAILAAGTYHLTLPAISAGDRVQVLIDSV